MSTFPPQQPGAVPTPLPVPPEAYPYSGAPSSTPESHFVQQSYAQNAQVQQHQDYQEFQAEQVQLLREEAAQRKILRQQRRAELRRQRAERHVWNEVERRRAAGIGRGPSKGEVNLVVAYILWFPFGIFGLHRFYLGQKSLGLAYLFTVGLFMYGWFFDLFLLPSAVRKANALRPLGLR